MTNPKKGEWGFPIQPPSPNLEAFFSLDKIHLNRCYQKILGVLSDDVPRTCDALEIETRLKHQTCSARIKELKDAGILISAGEGLTRSGRRAEKVIIHLGPPSLALV